MMSLTVYYAATVLCISLLNVAFHSTVVREKVFGYTTPSGTGLFILRKGRLKE